MALSESPRVLWVTNDFPPRSGGIEQFVANLCARMPPERVRVVTATHPDAGAFDDAVPYPVVRVAPRPLLPMPWLAERVREEAAIHDADVVVFGAGWPLGELAGSVSVPAAALTHGHEAGMTRVGAGLAVRHALRNIKAVGVISSYTRDRLMPWMPPDTAVHELPPGVDVKRFHPEVSGASVRRHYRLSADVPVVLCLSRLVARKGQDVLIEAWPGVLEQIPEAQLLIAGTGPIEAALRRRATKLGLNRNIRFTGNVPAAHLPAFHAAADIFAMPCRTRLLGLDIEGLGIVYLEAQACGTPVVAGASGGAPEAVLDGETGLVVDGRDIDQIAHAVVTLLADSERRYAMGEAGRRYVTEHYAWDVIAERFRDMVDALAGHHAPTR